MNLFDYYKTPSQDESSKKKKTSSKGRSSIERSPKKLSNTKASSKERRSKKSSLSRTYGRTIHGGAESKGHRKEYRPLSEKKWIHLTLKSAKAKGVWSFLTPKNQQIIRTILKEKSKKWGVQIAEAVNVGNHLHIKLRFKYREGFQNFLRAITSLIARKITKARKGNKTGKFWQGLAFTRVIKSRIEELQLKGYFEANRKQAHQGEAAREEFLKKFNAWIYRMRYRARAAASASA